MAKYKIDLLKKPTTKFNIAHVAYTLNLIEANEVLNNVFSYYSYDANDVMSAYIKYYKLNIYFYYSKIYLKKNSFTNFLSGYKKFHKFRKRYYFAELSINSLFKKEAFNQIMDYFISNHLLFTSRKKFNAVLDKLVSIHKNNLR